MTPLLPLAWRSWRHRLFAAATALFLVVGAGCSEETNPLAPYEGGRPLELLRVTQSFTPEMQWVGGRVAAVGINRGPAAALDTSLVWLRTASGNDIGSFITVGQDTDYDLVRAFGGTPADSLTDGEEYTFWIAERQAFEAALDSTLRSPGSFSDTTMTMDLVLRGRSGGDPALGVAYRVVREERLTESQFVVTWTPEVPLRRLAIRQGPTGGFTDLVWHVLVPEDEGGVILPPVVIGEAPPGTVEAVPFPAEGFAPSVHTLWGVTEDWEGGFGNFAAGYTFFQIFANNF